MVQQPNLASALPALHGSLPDKVAKRLSGVPPQDRRRDGGVRAALHHPRLEPLGMPWPSLQVTSAPSVSIPCRVPHCGDYNAVFEKG